MKMMQGALAFAVCVARSLLYVVDVVIMIFLYGSCRAHWPWPSTINNLNDH
jgi:hypothetical protein